MPWYIHLRIKEAGRCLNNADSLVVDRNGDEVILAILQHSHELKTKVLRVHFCREAVRNCLVGANFLDQRATDNGDADRSGLIVDHGQTRLRGLAVDELDAKDLRLGEGHGDGDIEVGSLRLVDCLLLSLRVQLLAI